MGCHCNVTEQKCTHQPEEAKQRVFPNNEKNPPYLPQASDNFASSSAKEELSGSAVGPWATGRVTWSQTAGITGVRPIVDRYSITRYSPKDWRRMNQQVLDKAFASTQLRKIVKCTLDTVVEGSDRHQSDNTARLEERLKEVRDCKDEVEALVKDFREEIVLLTETKIKMKFSLPALKMPESIAGECIERRTTRIEPDLVKDDVEVELVKELSMIKNARDLYENVIKEIEKQIRTNRSVKDLLELTWSDKKETCELDSINACLRNSTPIISYHGAAARFPESQSSLESWAIYNATLINSAKDELAKSRNLRRAAEENAMEGSVRDLKKQADKVHAALLKRIDEADQCRQMFENELEDVLKQISEAESLYGGLVKLQRQLDYNTKVVQTRLDNRLKRPRVENCRDPVEYGLMEEVKYLTESRTKLKERIDDIDKTVSKLYEARCNLEFVIMTRKKSLYIDQQRCMAYREKYPDATALTGGNA